MIKNVLLTLTIFVLTLSCNRTHKEVILTFADGKPELVYETKDVNGEKQRVAEEMFYNSGKVRYKRSFKDNKPYGVWEYYYENGNLFAKADFSNFNIGENWVFYYENGDKIFADDLEIKIVEITRDRMPITVEGTDGETAKQCQFYASYKLRSEGYFKGHAKEGDWVYYFENGNKQAYGKFVDNTPHGEHIIYHENGNIYYKGMYENGVRVGECEFYNDKGQKVAVKQFGEQQKQLQ